MTGKRKEKDQGRAPMGSPSKTVQRSKVKDAAGASPLPKKHNSTTEEEKIMESRRQDEEKNKKKDEHSAEGKGSPQEVA